MHFQSTLPAPGFATAALLPPRARRGTGPGPYQDSTLELWRGAQVLPLPLSALPGELLREFERQRGAWGRIAAAQART